MPRMYPLSSVAYAGNNTCQTTVAIAPLAPPTAVCKPNVMFTSIDGAPIMVPAAVLVAAIDGRSVANGGNTLTETLNPAPGVNGNYNLAIGTTPFTLNVSNCAGSATCSTTVTVTYQPVRLFAPCTAQQPCNVYN